MAAGAAVVGSGAFNGNAGNGGSGDNGSATSLAPVQRRTLSKARDLNGTLGYVGSYTVLGQGGGKVTWLPKVGQVVRQGQVLYRVNQRPVVLLYGSVPAYRTMAEGVAFAGASGADVAQLNHDLVALGYVKRADVAAAWDQFNRATKAGVEKLQEHLGVEQTGTLDLGDVVFLPTSARVTALSAALGYPATGPVLSATSTARTVSVALSPDLRSEVRAGDRVTIVLPGGSTTPGRVAFVGNVAAVSNSAGGSGGSGSGPSVPVRIRLTHPRAARGMDQVLVEVTVTDQSVRNVLAVPVAALLARSGGGYAVEVVDRDGTHHLVSVRLGLFDDAALEVQVTGPGLRAGQEVVVPGSE